MYAEVSRRQFGQSTELTLVLGKIEREIHHPMSGDREGFSFT